MERRGRAQGHADVTLDETGHEQAAAAAPYLASLQPPRSWTSDLARARQTCAHLEEATGLVRRRGPRLREFDVGRRQGLTIPEFAERTPRSTPPGCAATPPAAARRGDRGGRGRADAARPARLPRGLEPGETGVVVTHGAALKVGVVALLDAGTRPSPSGGSTTARG